MRDFTLSTYESYIRSLQESAAPFLTFREFFEIDQEITQCVLLRHDVDRKPANALKMAKLESDLGVRATYYFRVGTRNKKIIEEIASMGHEIGYHYECLSDSNGDFNRAYEIFENQLSQFRAIAEISTISMHGSPLKPYDNRDMWKSERGKQKLKELNIMGEVYLDIDYSDIAYVNDTGRNWSSGKSNRRDKVFSNINADFDNSAELFEYFKSPDKKLIFQVHPERWSNSLFEWTTQLGRDQLINLAKIAVHKSRISTVK